jgi:hypothetical protein
MATGELIIGSYVGIGAIPPLAIAAASTGSPIILASIRYTGPNRVCLSQYSITSVAGVAFSAANALTIAVRKLEKYTAEDTGGLDVSAYFGARKSSIFPPVKGFSARIATAAAGLVAGTYVALNSSVQVSAVVPSGTIGALPAIVGTLSQPVEFVSGEGLELIVLQATADATVRLGTAAQFDWYETARIVR